MRIVVKKVGFLVEKKNTFATLCRSFKRKVLYGIGKI